MQPKIALAMIVAPVDREAELLDRCLSGDVKSSTTDEQKNIDFDGVGSLADAVDGIFVTITGDNERVTQVAQKYNAVISHMVWEHDFAKARNFNFSQVPSEYDYIIWADADDVIRHPELIRDTIARCNEEAIDAVVMNYMYDFNSEGDCTVQHLKTRIVKNDGCVTWEALLVHEDFKQNRQITSFLSNEITYLHLTDKKRIDDSAKRNLMLAEMAVQKFPSDPRSYWNLANTYSMVGRHEEAINIFLQFLKISQSDEERFLSWIRLAGAYVRTNKLDYAIEAGLEAVSLRPWYPDGYFLLGEINYILGKHKVAREFVEMGLTKDIPSVDMIVWNPIDYTYNPHRVLAEIYMALNLPKKALKELRLCAKLRPKAHDVLDLIKIIKPQLAKFKIAEDIYAKAASCTSKEMVLELLDKLPEDVKYYTPIVALRNKWFTKTESSGKDVVIYCGFTSFEWNATTAKDKGVGGSEEAVIQLSKRFVKHGYNVTVYASTPGSQEFNIDGVKWLPFYAWNYRDKQDILIIWRHPKALDLQLNATKIYVDLHDVVDVNEFTPARIKHATKFMFKSKVQRELYKDIPDDKCLIIPHGLDIEEFESQRAGIERDPYLVLNTSSPDRGLKTCMDIIRRVYDRLPDDLKPKLKFAQYYGFNVWDSEFENDAQMQAWKNDAVNQMADLKARGIMTEDSGVRLSQAEITRRYLGAGILLYPSEFFEIGYIGGIKGMLAGCIPFTTNVFAQGEFNKEGYVVPSIKHYGNWARDIRNGSDYGVQDEAQIGEFVNGIVEYMRNPEKYEQMRQRLIEYAKESFNWDTTANAWCEDFIK